jgi:prepilin-type processing-associated H-X9-DG protein
VKRRGWVRKMPWLYVDGHVMDKKNIEKISIDIT